MNAAPVSGGVQKETTFAVVPSLRSEKRATAHDSIAGQNVQKIAAAGSQSGSNRRHDAVPLWDSQAAEHLAHVMLRGPVR